MQVTKETRIHGAPMVSMVAGRCPAALDCRSFMDFIRNN